MLPQSVNHIMALCNQTHVLVSLNFDDVIIGHGQLTSMNWHSLSVEYNNNNNDRLTAFDPGQPG